MYFSEWLILIYKTLLYENLNISCKKLGVALCLLWLYGTIAPNESTKRIALVLGNNHPSKTLEIKDNVNLTPF